jgi:RNA methyltransferase, TrmH family
MINERTPRFVTSAQNALVKDLRRALGQSVLTEDGYAAIEGMHIIEEAIRSGLRFKAVFFADSAQERTRKLIPQLSSHTELIALPDSIFNGAVTTETPQGVAAFVKLKSQELENLAGTPDPLFLAAAGIQDPGNLGTMIRSAEAFGATAMICAERTVSPLNSKVIRASAGSLFRLPVLKLDSAKFIEVARQAGARILATSSHKGTPLDEADLTGPVALFIGSEGAGVPKDLVSQVDDMIAIPHSPRVESLNAGIAASIIMYEAARQRRAGLQDGDAEE